MTFGLSIEFLVASGIGVLTAAGVYLTLRKRTFPVVLGIAMLSYAINVFLFAMGRLMVDRPPIYGKDVAEYTDPLPQALVLTAIVISFGMSAFVVVLALRAYLESGSDHVDGDPDDAPDHEDVLARQQREDER
ncbi:multicomponent K+:H+ antiporter subunit C [Erythrobacter litoralis]|jgi:multicomponent K+:H+ antiporter subunit C|uniref:Na+/H+ antiporter subunit C n=1 Tax=Erythrobacter sp. TaxID=1042 RepID=UPI000863B965|nr:Na+/H+ antiporter subunit C [Erythrobacter litoralis]AOL24443.1 multicomponent K+:H+ antiporter subunit C [Erythrobacter litoralis]MEE4339481.1 Na+/H+ antiporter subunit C [Erythrobacter sp.]